MITPLNKNTFEEFQLNAGAFLIGVDVEGEGYADATSARTALAAVLKNGSNTLGATRGGGTFTVAKEMRSPDVDGKRYGFVGDTFVDSIDASITGTLLQVNPENMKRLLVSADVEDDEKKHTLTMRTDIDEDDYIDTLVWVGDMANKGLVMIIFNNAINTANLTFTFTDKGEGTLPFEFHAKQSDVEQYDTAPYKIIFLDPDEG